MTDSTVIKVSKDQAEINKALSLMSYSVEHLAEASFKIRSNKEFLQLAVKINPEALKFVTNDKNIKDDRFFVFSALSSSNRDIVAKGVKWLGDSEQFKNDIELVNLAVMHDGLALKKLSKNFTQDKVIVLSAINNNPEAIMYMDEQLFNDPEILLFAFKRFNQINPQNDKIFPAFLKISDELKNDKDFVMSLLPLNNLFYMFLPKHLQNNEEIILEAISSTVNYEYKNSKCHYIYILDKIPEQLKSDKNIVIKAVQVNAEALQFASEQLKDDAEVVLAASWGMIYNNQTFTSEKGFSFSPFASQRIKNIVGNQDQQKNLDNLIFYEKLNNSVENKTETKKPKLKI